MEKNLKKENATCPVCEKKFFVKKSRFKRSKVICCSRDCGNKARSVWMKGDGNHQYGLKGHLNSSFKDGITKKRNNNQVDYWIYIPNHPFASKSGRVKYHRYLVEQNFEKYDEKYFISIGNGYYLKPDVIVHHKDGNHDNNEIYNLQVLTKGEHRSIHNYMNPMERNKENGQFVKTEKVKFKLLSKDAKAPYQATVGSAGWDMYAAKMEDFGDRVVYYTDVATEIPEGYAGLLLSRSSIVKTGLHLGNGVGLLDRDFRGNISFVFYKRENCELYKIGERIGQLVVTPTPKMDFIQAETLSKTDRGTGGYGSTGK